MTVQSLEWQNRAACRGEDIDLFFGGGGGNGTVQKHADDKAKTICDGCPVRWECLGYALDTDQRFGVWGGKSEDERRGLRRQRQRRANAA